MSTSVSPISSKSDGKEILFTWKFKDFIEVLSNYVRSPEFAALLDVRTVLALRRTSKAVGRIFNKEYVRTVIRLGNLEESLRLSFWAHNAPWLEYLRVNVALKNTSASNSPSPVSSMLYTINSLKVLMRGALKLKSKVYTNIRNVNELKTLSIDDRRRVVNIYCCLQEHVAPFPELLPIIAEVLGMAKDEEIAFWSLVGIFRLPWVAPFLPAVQLCGFDFHLYVISKIIKKCYKEVAKDMRNRVVELATSGAPYQPHLYDILVMVLWRAECRMGGWDSTKSL